MVRSVICGAENEIAARAIAYKNAGDEETADTYKYTAYGVLQNDDDASMYGSDDEPDEDDPDLPKNGFWMNPGNLDVSVRRVGYIQRGEPPVVDFLNG